MLVYTEERTEQVMRRAHISKVAAAAIAGICLLACIIMCTQTQTKNAFTMMLCSIAVSTFGGWIVILLIHLVYKPSKAEYAHSSWLQLCEKQIMSGRIVSTGQTFRIPGSIEVTKLRLASCEGESNLSIISRAAGLLPAAGRRVKLVTARGYITEVLYEEAQDVSE